MDEALAKGITSIEHAAGDPARGLPEDIFLLISRLTPLVNVDLLIRDDRGRTLLTWREDAYYGAGWHVPGGIIRFKETAAERLRAVAREELGAEADPEPAPVAFHEEIHPERAIRGHFISLLYRCVLIGPPDAARRADGPFPAPGTWRWHDGPPDALIDVHRVYEPFLK